MNFSMAGIFVEILLCASFWMPLCLVFETEQKAIIFPELPLEEENRTKENSRTSSAQCDPLQKKKSSGPEFVACSYRTVPYIPHTPPHNLSAGVRHHCHV
jgi:hypothetical protein